ncbi:MAG: Thiazole synthase [Chlamydiales bacterium]|nr:Thiazole synthase [Chlamydiales bacterium]
MLTIAGKSFQSRLLIGTARYPDPSTRLKAIEASGAEVVTVSIRRIHVDEPMITDLTDRFFVLPNTAGCFTAKEAVLTAQLAREALNTNWIKLEVIGDEKTLYPDTSELLKAAHELVKEGFVVLPYCNDDPIVCQKLADLGCAAIMPLAAPIGSGMGILNRYILERIREQISLPLIVDAGLGTASDVAIAMEMGMDGVLVNTAVAKAHDPIQMAHAMRLAVEAGRLAYRAGRIPYQTYATASTPLQGVLR